MGTLPHYRKRAYGMTNDNMSSFNTFLILLLLSFRCQYAGKACGPEDFSQTVTNYGVCYTFNSARDEQDEPLMAKTPG